MSGIADDTLNNEIKKKLKTNFSLIYFFVARRFDSLTTYHHHGEISTDRKTESLLTQLNRIFDLFEFAQYHHGEISTDRKIESLLTQLDRVFDFEFAQYQSIVIILV